MYGKLNSGEYAALIQARDSCGLYENTDSVDLVTLSTKYETDYSTPLINSIVNAVDYTESDFSYGHGITAYSPYNYVDYYSQGRDSLVQLSYDSNIIGFYDAYATLQLAYMYGTTEAANIAGTWYDSSIITTYNGSSSNQNVEAAQQYDIDTTVVNGNTVVELSDDDWDIINHFYCDLLVKIDDTHYVYLGEDLYSDFDNDWNLLIKNPDKWTYINGHLATYFNLDSYKDSESGQWNQTGCVYAYVNGEEALLLVYFDQDNPSGSIMGYMPYDFATSSSDDENYYTLNDNDKINLAYISMNTDTYEIDEYYAITGNEFYFKDAYVSYQSLDLSTDTSIIYYTIEDVYGNTYETPAYLVENGKIVS